MRIRLNCEVGRSSESGRSIGADPNECGPPRETIQTLDFKGLKRSGIESRQFYKRVIHINGLEKGRPLLI